MKNTKKRSRRPLAAITVATFAASLIAAPAFAVGEDADGDTKELDVIELTADDVTPDDAEVGDELSITADNVGVTFSLDGVNVSEGEDGAASFYVSRDLETAIAAEALTAKLRFAADADELPENTEIGIWYINDEDVEFYTEVDSDLFTGDVELFEATGSWDVEPSGDIVSYGFGLTVPETAVDAVFDVSFYNFYLLPHEVVRFTLSDADFSVDEPMVECSIVDDEVTGYDARFDVNNAGDAEGLSVDLKVGGELLQNVELDPGVNELTVTNVALEDEVTLYVGTYDSRNVTVKAPADCVEEVKDEEKDEEKVDEEESKEEETSEADPVVKPIPTVVCEALGDGNVVVQGQLVDCKVVVNAPDGTNVNIKVELNPVLLDTTEEVRGGEVPFSFRVPTDAAVGSNVIITVDGEEVQGAGLTLNVSAATATTTAADEDRLADTGANAALLAMLGLLLAGSGVGALRYSYGRNN